MVAKRPRHSELAFGPTAHSDSVTLTENEMIQNILECGSRWPRVMTMIKHQQLKYMYAQLHTDGERRKMKHESVQVAEPTPPFQGFLECETL